MPLLYIITIVSIFSAVILAALKDDRLQVVRISDR
jgi:hypothetical protein